MAPRNSGDKAMSNTNTGGPAFPTATLAQKTEGGMTLRTYIAIEVMKALLTNPNCELDPIREVVPASFGIADAMIQEVS
jgi:hypothetical protein